MPEKDLSGWSNLPSFALRKNVVKGSYKHKNRQIHFKGNLGLWRILQMAADA